MKKMRDKSLIPYIALVVVVMALFFGVIFYAARSGLYKRDFWLECANFTNAQILYSEYNDEKYQVLPDNVKSFGSLMLNDLFATDDDISVTGKKVTVYAPTEDFVYCMTLEQTTDSRVTRITLEGKKRTYCYDYEGLDYFGRFVRALTEKGYQKPNNKMEEFPFEN